MYYDNKRTFYVKQYGPTVLVSVIAIALISTGVIYYFNVNGKAQDDNIANNPDGQPLVDVATNVPNGEEKPNENVQAPAGEEQNKPSDEIGEMPEETFALQNTDPVPYFNTLEKLTLSDNVSVTSVDEKGNVSLKHNKGDTLVVSMIGIDYTYATDATYNKIKTDLEGKEVKIAFDTERQNGDISTAYVYLNGKLYNADLLGSGLATLKSERINVALATDLSKAQADARSNKLGVWNR